MGSLVVGVSNHMLAFSHFFAFVANLRSENRLPTKEKNHILYNKKLYVYRLLNFLYK